jgi:ferritin-like metal-binding protein YciE
LNRHSFLSIPISLLKKQKAMATKSSTKSNTKAGGKAAKSTRKKREPVTNSQLQEFFIDCLKDIYWAEKHLTKALPKMQKSATTPQLQEAIETHLDQTMEHVTRLEQVFEIVGEKPVAKKCDAMEGLTKEAESIMEETDDGSMTRDAAIILAAQKVEHYEIATYGGLVEYARTLGYDDAVEILQSTLDEEKETDQLLTGIAENDINWQAEQEGGEGEGEETEEEE